MKRLFSLFVLSLFWVAQAFSASELKYETFYLDNGLKVVLCEEHSQPEVFGAMYVHVGSKDDPADATGMAHYFEHIMFKGTDKIGTIDWEAEKVYLDSIDMMYTELHATDDAEARKAIQRKINELSIASSQYAIPNEVDLILAGMGGTGLNAGTSYDHTIYYNSFPSNQLAKWMDVYAERFRYPVFRLFQSELETVYEEKNMYADQPIQNFIELLFAKTFGEHPYGRPIVGETEHLKNPQPLKMREFYEQWYVANNMTLVLCGDLNIAEAKKLATSKFAGLKKANLPARPVYQIPEFKGHEIIDVKMTPIKLGALIYKGVKCTDADNMIMQIVSGLLSNSGSGLIDQKVLNGDLLGAEYIPLSLQEAGANIILYIPKLIGQSHEQAAQMVTSVLDSIKAGAFSDELFQSVKNVQLRGFVEQQESMASLSNLFTNLENEGLSYEQYLQEIERFRRITKEDVVAAANKYFSNDYLEVRSSMGSVTPDKVEKPDWKPIEAQNINEKSAFAQYIESQVVPETQPQVIDFEKDVVKTVVNEGYTLYSCPNPVNDLFDMEIHYGYGIMDNPDIERAVSFFELQGTQEKSLEELSLALNTYAAQFSVSVQDNDLVVNVSGFEKDFDAIMALVTEKLFTPGQDAAKIKLIVDSEKSDKKMIKDDANQWAKVALAYVKYGNQSMYLNRMPLRKWKKLSAETLNKQVQEAFNHKGYVSFTGNICPLELGARLEALNLLNGREEASMAINAVNTYDENTIFTIHNKKFRQSNIFFNVTGNTVPEEQDALMTLYNKYFGLDMYSIVFQEIREFRSLGYTAYAYLNQDWLDRQPALLTGFLGTQSDKTLDGIDIFYQLITDMPERMEKFNTAKQAVILARASDYVSFRNRPTSVANWEKAGYTCDPRAVNTERIRQAGYDDVYSFYQENVKGRPVVIVMSGNMKRIDPNALKHYGKVVSLKWNKIYKK